ncbi:MAG TPA: DUF6695 family protein [Sphingobacteriaceae bacterium]|nr:DUF6695 family protein [Sphingobacteriaceae bacterium]
MENSYHDLAIILAWPDATIRGDEAWMMFFRKIGLVKNLNFKVGHTGVILVDSRNSSLLYYDFGRYIAPRGLGRARSPFSDPRLRLRTKAHIVDKKSGQISNLQEIAEELEEIKAGTQGEGRLFFSVATAINFFRAKKYADQLVNEGSTPYGAFARGNNNCSRFITRLLMRSSKKYNFFHGINLPETIKSSPMSNVVNVRKDRKVYIYEHPKKLQKIRITRTGSLFFLLKQLKDNFNLKRAGKLPGDIIVGSVNELPKPSNIPQESQWLGGVGEGAWYHLEGTEEPLRYLVSRYTETGELEYALPFISKTALDLNEAFKIEYDSHMVYTTVSQNGKIFKMEAIVPTEDAPIGIIDFTPTSELAPPLELAKKG